MPIREMKLSVVIPAYLEAENLQSLLPVLTAVLAQHCQEWEILVVDTNPPQDATPEVCAAHPGVRHLCRSGGNNYGDAIRSGIQNAVMPLIAVMDADGSHAPDNLPRMLESARQNEVVIASRYIKGGSTMNPRFLIFLSALVNLFYRLFLRIPVRDISNSFRIYRRDQLQSLELLSSNFEIVEEILIKLFLLYPKNRVSEVPCCFQRRMFGESKRDLVRFAFSYAFSIFHLLQLKARVLRKKRSV